MHHRTTTTVTTLILCACLLLSGCSAQARQRDLIRKDPMASATWDGIEFLGSQGDIWDAQKDMLADTLGAATSLLLFLMIRPDKRLGER